MVEDTAQQSDRVSAAAVLQFAAREAREGRRFAEFGAHAFASITYNAYVTEKTPQWVPFLKKKKDSLLLFL